MISRPLVCGQSQHSPLVEVVLGLVSRTLRGQQIIHTVFSSRRTFEKLISPSKAIWELSVAAVALACHDVMSRRGAATTAWSRPTTLWMARIGSVTRELSAPHRRSIMIFVPSSMWMALEALITPTCPSGHRSRCRLPGDVRRILGGEAFSVNQFAMCCRFELYQASPSRVEGIVGDGSGEFMAEMSVLVLLP